MIKYRMTERSKEFPETVKFIPPKLGHHFGGAPFALRRKHENLRYKTMETSERSHPSQRRIHGSDGTADRQTGER